jgi:glycosyltransferase involved in cell wall biosynthesis
MRLRSMSPVRIQVASRFMSRGLEENGFDLARVDVVPLFAEPPPAALPAEPGLILLPSRLVRPKGVGVALDALAILGTHRWRLAIAGDGLNREEFRSQARRLEIADRIDFLGEVAPNDLAPWYARAQIVLFPVVRREPFGLIGVEALAYGKPIVAFSGGAVDEWLWPGETGLRVDERTPVAFAAAVRELLISPERCAAMGQAAKARYAYFHPTAYVERLMAAFERTVRWHRDTAR